MRKENCLYVISKKDAVPLNNNIEHTSCTRNEVHKNGYWHCGIQANLVRLDSRGILQILVQRRSHSVDISKMKKDQSLATQRLFTDRTIESSFERGLKEELGIKLGEIKYFNFLPNANFFISKKYEEDSELFNREKLSLFVATLSNTRKLTLSSHRVNSIEWVDWNLFVNDIYLHPEEYTKTVRFYVVNDLLKNILERQMSDFIKGRKLSAINDKDFTTIYYSPADNKDFLAHNFMTRSKMELLNMKYAY